MRNAGLATSQGDLGAKTMYFRGKPILILQGARNATFIPRAGRECNEPTCVRENALTCSRKNERWAATGRHHHALNGTSASDSRRQATLPAQTVVKNTVPPKAAGFKACLGAHGLARDLFDEPRRSMSVHLRRTDIHLWQAPQPGLGPCTEVQ